jgi:hypothetical protein
MILNVNEGKFLFLFYFHIVFLFPVTPLTARPLLCVFSPQESEKKKMFFRVLLSTLCGLRGESEMAFFVL